MRIILLARRYMAYHRWKTVLLVAAVSLPTFLPVAIYVLLGQFQQELFARAETTPTVIGAKGSRFDLALHALYFQAMPPDAVTMGELNYVHESGLADAVPLFIRDTAGSLPVVGTTPEYFEFRNLHVESGDQLVRLGDCVLGAEAAAQLKLGPGDQLLTDPENVFDIAGQYPLKMRVRGVLGRTYSADDRAVFVDLKTAWIIQGIGHGHQDLKKDKKGSVILEKKDGLTTANAALANYTEITDENIGSFHFHGDQATYPITAVLALPDSPKSKTLLEGRYHAGDREAQLVLPEQVVRELMQIVFRFKRFFDANTVLVAASTVLFVGIVVLLSLRLRRQEMHTMFKIGCSRMTVFLIQATELGCVLLASAIIVGCGTWLTSVFGAQLVRSLLG